jgi:KipI family sensor histidine kinase inhibitor
MLSNSTTVVWLADHGVQLHFSGPPSVGMSARVHALCSTLTHQPLAFQRNVCAGLCSVTVYLHPGFDQVMTESTLLARALHGLPAPLVAPIKHNIPFHCDAETDLPEISRITGLSSKNLVQQFVDAEFTVAMIGFAPGFPYLLGLPPALRVARKRTPALQVPAGSVAIADAFAGIYPRAMPGGWHVLGQTDAVLFDPQNLRRPSLLLPGDVVRFVAV